MSDQSTITTKEELLSILRETIETISNTPVKTKIILDSKCSIISYF
jgi:hypothetical protein